MPRVRRQQAEIADASRCFACSEPASGIVRRVLDGSWREAEACDEHGDPDVWTEQTSSLFTRVARWVKKTSREAGEEIAEELIEGLLG